jgi:hypothetical protein
MESSSHSKQDQDVQNKETEEVKCKYERVHPFENQAN